MGRACWLVQTMMIILSGTFLTRLCSFDPCVTSHPWVAAPPLSEEAGSLLPVGPGVVDGGLVIACWSLAPLHLVRQQLAARWRPELERSRSCDCHPSALLTAPLPTPATPQPVSFANDDAHHCCSSILCHTTVMDHVL